MSFLLNKLHEAVDDIQEQFTGKHEEEQEDKHEDRHEGRNEDRHEERRDDEQHERDKKKYAQEHAEGQSEPSDDHSNHRFKSFAVRRNDNDVKYYIDGCCYMWAVSVALERAKESVWILDWWLSPELYLRRPLAKNEQYRIDRMLQAAAERGVKVNIIVYKEVTQALTLSSSHTKHALEDLHPNIMVFRHPDHIPDAKVLQSSIMDSLQNMSLTASSASKLPGDTLKALYGVHEDTVLYWAHHEKLCLVDGHTAFMGGLDLCYGRWDTHQHSIADAHPGNLDNIVFPGQDFNNARIMDFQDVANWKNNKLDRTKNSRMGWSDLSICISGPVVNDLKKHFVDRWNFIFNEKYDHKNDRDYQHLTVTGNSGQSRERGGSSQGGAVCQLTRSCAKWSHGIGIEHSIANAYIEVIKNSKHFVYIENQFFITATSDDMKKPIKNMIGAAIVERIVRAARNGEKYKMIINIPAVPAFAGDLRSDDALSTRAIMEFQYNSINRGHGQSIMERISEEGIDPSEYLRFYNLRNYDRINASGAMRDAEQKSGVSYGEAQEQYDKKFGGVYEEEGGLRSYNPPPPEGFDRDDRRGPRHEGREGHGPRGGYEREEEYGERPGHRERPEYGERPGYGEREGHGPRGGYDEDRGFGERPRHEERSEYGERGHGPRGGYEREEEYGERRGHEERPGHGRREEYGEREEYGGREEYGRRQERSQERGQREERGQNDRYDQYQRGAKKIGDHQGLGSGRWDSVASCYMLGGEDIRNVPWEGGEMDEIDAFVSEELYIHSKLLIADDRVVICGSANLNDRSQCGDHDSEIAMVIEDQHMIDSRMNGEPWRAAKFAASLRRHLFRKHLGLLKPQDFQSPNQNYEPIGTPNHYDWDSREDQAVADPLSDEFLELWNGRAKTNTEAFARVFHPVPCDDVRTWKQYDEYYERFFKEDKKDKDKEKDDEEKDEDEKDEDDKKDKDEKPSTYKWGHVVAEEFSSGPDGVKEVKEVLSKVRGTLVEMPLMFLNDEDIAKEGLGLNPFTEAVYT
ncbi:MAG: hypothetical protein M1834_006760 [Cirrosporium novae-zelandiae]|nr:MAG: hypothetical protein M1834_006760 [Cirrosporium novae-zelandiae]